MKKKSQQSTSKNQKSKNTFAESATTKKKTKIL
jgi:hypothetical protein